MRLVGEQLRIRLLPFQRWQHVVMIPGTHCSLLFRVVVIRYACHTGVRFSRLTPSTVFSQGIRSWPIAGRMLFPSSVRGFPALLMVEGEEKYSGVDSNRVLSFLLLLGCARSALCPRKNGRKERLHPRSRRTKRSNVQKPCLGSIAHPAERSIYTPVRKAPGTQHGPATTRSLTTTTGS